ncbi:LppU/SCO3897 family protein [Mycobacterium intracellulare]|uniref:LppU/SCO3897 family protein n=1 Tax=Mycobacterium intracellulare TaxID=1767 RepID=UPI003AF8861B
MFHRQPHRRAVLPADRSHHDATWTPADCDNPRLATFKVFKRIDGSVDETQCPAGTKANSYPSPARVYCLARVD